MIQTHINENMNLILQEIYKKCFRYSYIPRFKLHYNMIVYEISVKDKPSAGIIYQYSKCFEMSPIDLKLDLEDNINFVKVNGKLYDNDYVCCSCKRDKENIFVNFDTTQIETFCNHTSYIDDEFEIILNI